MKAPLIISEYMFDPVTLVDKPNGKLKERQLLSEMLLPKFASTPSWPPVTYTAFNGITWTTAPGLAFPTP